MNGLDLAAIRVRFMSFFNDANRQDRTLKTYAEVRSDLLTCYNPDAVIVEALDRITKFKHGLLTLRDFSGTLLDITLRCSCVYEVHTLRRFISEGIVLFAHSTMRRLS